MKKPERSEELDAVMRELEASREPIRGGDPEAAREAEAAVERHERAGRGGKSGVFGTVAVLLVLTALYFKFAGSEKKADEDDKPPPVGDKAGAWGMAGQLVRERLKAPKTSEFGCDSGKPEDKCVEELGGGRFRIRGRVDSQNSFGVVLRSDFNVTIEHLGDDRWKTIAGPELTAR